MNIRLMSMGNHEYFPHIQTENWRKIFVRGNMEGERCRERLPLKVLSHCKRLKKVYPFVKFEMIQPFLCYLLDPKEVQ